MTGVLWAAISGIGFGFFQAFNRRAGLRFDAYRSTFWLVFISTLILFIGSTATEDLSSLMGAPLRAYVNFALAGIIHFFMGWTFLSISQDRVGAARTGALVGATPLFATAIGVIGFGEFLNLPTFLGVFIVVAGVYLVSNEERNRTPDLVKKQSTIRTGWRASLFGLGTAVCFATSSIFIRWGLEYVSSPLLGGAVAMLAATSAYGVALFFRRKNLNGVSLTLDAILFQVAAAIFVGLSTWMRWVALDLAPIAVVLALGRLNVPMVILISPYLVGKKQEKVTARVWVGATLIVAGSLVLIFFR